VEVEGVWPEAIPERLTLDVNGDRFPILFLVRGRPRTCFLCECFGHSQGESPSPFCNYCRQEVHRVNECERKKQNDADTVKSYNDWLRKNGQAQKVQSGIVEGPSEVNALTSIGLKIIFISLGQQPGALWPS
jgi:hypothetical protein